MKKYLSFLISIVIVVGAVFACTVSASAYTGTVEKDGVMQMGDFDSLVDGFIVYYPKDLEQSDHAYPVAVWANGTMCAPALYQNLLIGVAKQGYIVIASPDLMPKDGKGQSAAIDYIFEQSMDETSPFFGKVDPNKIGAFGHSQGGLSSVNAAVADHRIGAIVSIAGSSTKTEAKNLTVPSLFLTGTADYVVLSSLWVKPSFEACQGPAVYASLKNGVHTSCIADADTYVNYVVKWFNAWFNNDGNQSVFRNGGELSKDTAWKDYQSKNMNAYLTGSVFSDGGSVWMLAALAELAVIVCLGVYIGKRKHSTAGGNKE